MYSKLLIGIMDFSLFCIQDDSLLASISCRWGLSFDPLNSLAHLPNTLAFLAFFDVNTFAVLLALTPLSNVLATIWPLEGSVSVLLVILIATYISTAITPSESSLTFHFIVDPLATINSTVSPFIFSLAMNIILEKVTFISALI